MNFIISFNKRAVGLLLVYICLILGDIGMHPIFAYSDEIATIGFMAYILLYLLLGKLTNQDMLILFFLSILTILGIVSNCLSEVSVSIFAILIDILWLFKIYSGYIGIRYLLRDEKVARTFLSYMSSAAKIFIFLAFFGALLNTIMDVGLSDDIRYGLRSYSFVIGNSGHFGMIVASALAFIIAEDRLSRKKIRMYYVMAFFEIILTTKLMPILIVVVTLLLKNQQSKKKIKLKYIVAGAISILIIGQHQIIHYISDLNHPRMRLIIYGIKTAMIYFPFGSGFATYGSEMARRYYSPIYTYWGFESFYGLSPTSDSCLNDNYMAMILAQGGVISFLLFLSIMYIIFEQTVKKTDLQNSNTRNILVALYVSMLATSVMSGTFKGAVGMLTFMTMGVLETRRLKAKQIKKMVYI